MFANGAQLDAGHNALHVLEVVAALARQDPQAAPELLRARIAAAITELESNI